MSCTHVRLFANFFLLNCSIVAQRRATWLSWRRPNFGSGSIRDREKCDLKLYSRESSESRLYTPLQVQYKRDAEDEEAGVFYNDLLRKCLKSRVAIDIVLHTRPKHMAFLDIATLGELCRGSSGRLSWIRSADFKEQLKGELWCVSNVIQLPVLSPCF